MFLKFVSKIRCHPERSLARFLRQTQSKDLRFGTSTYVMNFGNTTLASSRLGRLFFNRQVCGWNFEDMKSCLHWVKPGGGLQHLYI